MGALVAGTAGGVIAVVVLEPVALGAMVRTSGLVVTAAVAPLTLGWLAGSRLGALARRVAPWLSRTSMLLLVVTIGLLAIRHADRATVRDLLAASVVVLASLAIGLVARPCARTIAIAQISGVRNLTLALLVLASIGAAPDATSAVLAYGLVMYLSTGALAWIARRGSAR